MTRFARSLARSLRRSTACVTKRYLPTDSRRLRFVAHAHAQTSELDASRRACCDAAVGLGCARTSCAEPSAAAARCRRRIRCPVRADFRDDVSRVVRNWRRWRCRECVRILRRITCPNLILPEKCRFPGTMSARDRRIDTIKFSPFVFSLTIAISQGCVSYETWTPGSW